MTGISGLEALCRLVAGGYFVNSGIQVLRNRHENVTYCRSRMPAPGVLVPAGALMMIAGGGGLGIGFRPDVSSGLLVAFLLLANLTVHPFWKKEEFSTVSKNFALAALLGLVALSGYLGTN